MSEKPGGSEEAPFQPRRWLRTAAIAAAVTGAATAALLALYGTGAVVGGVIVLVIVLFVLAVFGGDDALNILVSILGTLLAPVWLAAAVAMRGVERGLRARDPILYGATTGIWLGLPAGWLLGL